VSWAAAQPVVLATDALIYVLLLVGLAYAVVARRREHLRAPWRRVARSRTAMASLVVLMAYLVIGLLDSLHFHPPLASQQQRGDARHSSEVLSVLDVVLAPLRERKEKTYSAPLATHLYAKETIERSDGSTVRDHPRLRYGGAHLADPHRDFAGDVLGRVLAGLAGAAVAWAAVVLLLGLRLAARRREALRATLSALLKGRTELPWHAALYTLGAVLALAGVAVSLAGHYHVLGTDKVGQDVLYQALKSVRTGLVIGTLTTLVMLPAAIVLGVGAGYFRGWVDDVVQYLYTTLNSIPGVLLIAAAILMMQVYIANHEQDFASITERADLRLLFLCLILGVTSWTSLCRLLRGETLKLRELDYVQAAHAFGVRHHTVIRRHMLPNVLHIVLITVVLDFSGLVLAEAVLSYVNIGVDPTTESWGNMINGARLELAREPVVWWSLTAALGFMFVLVLAANLFADVVRDALDPRLGSGR
jgi:peptide/nickel transport system permease protein